MKKGHKIGIGIIGVSVLIIILWLIFFSGFRYIEKAEFTINLVCSVIGAIVTLIGIIMTIDYYKEQFETDVAIRLRPHLRIMKENNSSTSDLIYFNATAEKLKESSYKTNSMEARINIKNIGAGSALKIETKIGEYNGKISNYVENNYIFDLTVNEDKKLIMRMYWEKDGTYTLNISYLDIMQKSRYNQNWLIIIENKQIKNIDLIC